MNREDIIKMAREAGLTGLMEGGLIDYFERFANLVAAAEREACAQICENDAAKFGVTDDVCAALIRARGLDE
jgi:hypothetical protein